MSRNNHFLKSLAFLTKVVGFLVIHVKIKEIVINEMHIMLTF